MDDLLAFNLRWLDKWTKLEYDGLHFADDWGDQRRLMIKPDLWRRLFKPRYAQMFRRAHDAGMDVWFHSDGRINDIFGDLIEIGVDVINCQVAVLATTGLLPTLEARSLSAPTLTASTSCLSERPAVKEEVQRVFEACGTLEGGLLLRRGWAGRAAGEHPGHVRGLSGILTVAVDSST